jgi:hypothetical protein
VELYLHSPNTPSWRGAQGEHRDDFTFVEEMRNACKILVGKPERKTPLGRLKPEWKDNRKSNRKEIGCEGVDRIDLAQDEHSNASSSSIKDKGLLHVFCNKRYM